MCYDEQMPAFWPAMYAKALGGVDVGELLDSVSNGEQRPRTSIFLLFALNHRMMTACESASVRAMFFLQFFFNQR